MKEEESKSRESYKWAHQAPLWYMKVHLKVIIPVIFNHHQTKSEVPYLEGK
jgi:hypothetical protein